MVSMYINYFSREKSQFWLGLEDRLALNTNALALWAKSPFLMYKYMFKKASGYIT
jgi:hypothetical protein